MLVYPLPADGDVMPVYRDRRASVSGLLSGRTAFLGCQAASSLAKLVLVCCSLSALACRPSLYLCSTTVLEISGTVGRCSHRLTSGGLLPLAQLVLVTSSGGGQEGVKSSV